MENVVQICFLILIGIIASVLSFITLAQVVMFFDPEDDDYKVLHVIMFIFLGTLSVLAWCWFTWSLTHPIHLPA